MFKQLRRTDRRLDDAAAAKLLQEGSYGVLSTVDSGGYPYGVPVNYVFYEGALYFHGAADGHKHQNLLANPRASFCVVERAETVPEKFTTRYASVIVFGQLEEVLGADKEEAMLAFLRKYAGAHVEEGMQRVHQAANRLRVLRLNIELITGKSNL